MKIKRPDSQNMDSTNIPSADEIIQMEKALSGRPSLSIRFRIILAFLVTFIFSFGIGISSIFYISEMNSKQNFFDHAAKFAFTVEQARRHEKNYFLYHTRTDLFDALSNIKSAELILEDAASEMRFLLEHDTFKNLTNNLNQYQAFLNQIAYWHNSKDEAAKLDESNIEGQLRIYGHQILTDAMDLMDQERNKVHRTAQTFMLAAGFSLIINLIVMIWVAMELARQIVQPLGRAVQYTERIAAGNFDLVIPQRKFRDEFSNLAIAINRMIFELMEKHEQLVQSRKMAAVGTLTSGIAHELNNPLNNISITTEALMESLDDYTHDEVMEMLKDIFIQVERSSATVRNLLDFTRLGKSKVEALDASDLIQSTLKLVKNEHTLKGIEAKTLIAANLPKVKGNFRNLQQVLINIFLNGIQAMPEGGILSIKADQTDEKYIKIDVKDQGCGIAKKNIQKIFDPFFTTKDVGAGTGLGLSVSYGIIQEIGGRITVDSEEGRGTTFSVYLPVVEDKEQ